MQKNNYSKDYTFLDGLQSVLHCPWYTKIILLFVHENKYVGDDAMICYKVFRGVTYITKYFATKNGRVKNIFDVWNDSDKTLLESFRPSIMHISYFPHE
jgi:hypothetical protein